MIFNFRKPSSGGGGSAGSGGGVTSVGGTLPISSSGGATPVITHSTADGYKHVPATGTTNNGKVLMAGATAGSFSWSSLLNATVSVDGLMSSADKAKLDGIAANANNYIKPASEPISYITNLQATLDSKATNTALNVEKSRIDAILASAGANADTFAEIVALINSVDTENDTAFSGYVLSNNNRSTAIENTLINKVDIIAGKGLSTEDYTTTEKNKLSGLSNYTLPVASTTKLGGVKAGANVTIDANGVLSANDTNVSFSEISGKPTNISGYGITDAYTKTQVDTMVGNIASALDTINGQVI